MKKAQVSFEFIMIFTFVFMALIGFLYIINERLFEVSEQRDRQVLKNLATNIVNEAILASSANNNYVRKFNIPVKIFGKDYRMSIDNNELFIEVFEGDEVVLDYFTPFPVKVKGNFIGHLTLNTTEHCISKNDIDGIRISRTQASIDINSTEARISEPLELYISLHCVQYAKSARFTILYDPDVLQLIDAEPVTWIDLNHRYHNPLFEDVRLMYTFPPGGEWINEDEGRFTYGYVGSNCVTGSGNFALLKFLVKDTAPLGTTYLEFDKDIEESINILDCFTDNNTIDGLPDSRNNAKIEIVS